MGTTNTFQRTVGGRTLTVETGKLAEQAHGSVTVTYGDTIVLVTACMAPQPRPGADFFPLTVDFEERLYAAGKIPGGFFKREGRPGQDAILTCRLVDRPLRPLFSSSLRNEIQIIITVLSTDRENEPEIPAIIGASAALSISEIPFKGPVAGSRVGYINGELVLNPTFTELADLVVVGNRDAVVMVEAGAKEVPEQLALDAVRYGQEANQEVLDLQQELIKACAKPKIAVPEEPAADEEFQKAVSAHLGDRLDEALGQVRRGDRETVLAELEEDVIEKLGQQYPAETIAGAVQSQVKKAVRAKILDAGIRPDGRGLEELRDISCEVGLLPRTHGSGMFTRGQTQVLAITTLGSLGEMQKIDNISQEERKRFMHHYNFPPFSVGETRRIGSPGRREIGHGALAERALAPVIPDEEEFPYTIRLVSETLGSNGSTSMASVCGSSLSLMDAGVPVKAAVAGVAIGLVTDDNGRHAVLTDIAGIEDAMGDMDFKVAGTDRGMTAWQMDLKLTGLTMEIIEKAMAQAVDGRRQILDVMNGTIRAPRSDLSRYAPRITQITIDREKIGSVIGPGGKTIRSIIEETGTTVDVDDDGTVTIGATDPEAAGKAVELIEKLTSDVEVGAIYTGKVTRIMNFGAFVEILPGKEGLVHISELAPHRVNSVEDVVKVDDEITVMVTELDRLGRINLSRRALLENLSEVGTTGPGDGGGPGRDRTREPRGSQPPFRREGRPSHRGPGRSERGPGNQGYRGRRR
ncbi:MAG: polyribonucleotide nucleotidyltransferase [Dehalococcoidia bacterium]